jgi:membrane fusion protein (multidrug efflux system)
MKQLSIFLKTSSTQVWPKRRSPMERLNSSQNNQQVAQLEEKEASDLEQQAITAGSAKESKDNNSNTAASPSWRRLVPLVALGVLLGAGAIASGIYAYRRWLYAQSYLQTDKAYVLANIYPVTARVSGIVTEVTVKDNQMISPGTVLVKLDPRDYQISLAQAKASLELAKQQAALAQEKIKSAAFSNILSLSIPEPPAGKPSKSTSSQTNLTKENLPQLSAISQQRELNEQQYKTALAAIAQKQAEVKKAELQLSYTKVTAVVGGKVANKNVQVGQRVEPGQTLLTIVQPDPWVVANFPETELEKIQPGQSVEIEIAAFASHKFQGKVDSMYPTSTGFGLGLETGDRPTGNFIRSGGVQQIPVKIVFDPNSIKGYESRLAPGMSAVVKLKAK